MDDSHRPPAILVSAFLVSLAAEFLIGVHPLAYLFALMFAMLGAAWITAGSLFKELGEYANWRRIQREKRKKV